MTTGTCSFTFDTFEPVEAEERSGCTFGSDDRDTPQAWWAAATERSDRLPPFFRATTLLLPRRCRRRTVPRHGELLDEIARATRLRVETDELDELGRPLDVDRAVQFARRDRFERRRHESQVRQVPSSNPDVLASRVEGAELNNLDEELGRERSRPHSLVFSAVRAIPRCSCVVHSGDADLDELADGKRSRQVSPHVLSPHRLTTTRRRHYRDVSRVRYRRPGAICRRVQLGTASSQAAEDGSRQTDGRPRHALEQNSELHLETRRRERVAHFARGRVCTGSRPREHLLRLDPLLFRLR